MSNEYITFKEAVDLTIYLHNINQAIDLKPSEVYAMVNDYVTRNQTSYQETDLVTGTIRK